MGHTQGMRSLRFWGVVCILMFEFEVFLGLCSRCEVSQLFLRVCTKV